MEKRIPEIIKKVGFDFNWDERKVWALDVPVEEMNIAELEWHFNIPFWSTKDGYYNLKPREVIKNKEEHREEYERTMNSNLIHPLDIMNWKGRWLLLDGLHRLVKSKILREKTVKVRKIPKKYISKIKK